MLEKQEGRFGNLNFKIKFGEYIMSASFHLERVPIFKVKEGSQDMDQEEREVGGARGVWED